MIERLNSTDTTSIGIDQHGPFQARVFKDQTATYTRLSA